MNALLMHQLDLYEECSPATGVEGCSLLTKFVDVFHFWFYWMFRVSCHQQRFEEMDNKSIIRIITVLIDNCVKIEQMLKSESKVVPSRKLLDILKESILAATGLIMKLHKRNRPIQGIYRTEENQAKHMLKELITKIPEVVSKPINFRKPLQHIIIDRHLKAAKNHNEKEQFMDNDICKLIVEVIDDIDAVDNEGNTLLLTVSSLLQFDYSHLDDEERPSTPALQIIDFLISQCAYTYAKNSKGKTVTDYLEDFVMKNDSNEAAQSILAILKSQVPSLQSLAAMNAKDLLPAHKIPPKIQRILKMH